MSFLVTPAVKTVTTGAFLLLMCRFAQASETETSEQRPLPFRRGNFALQIEPGVALPLTSPQSRMFDTGGGQTVKALWTVNEQTSVGPSATFLALPAEAAHREAGTAWALGPSLRLRLFRNGPDRFLLGMSPWVDADVLYVRTGGIDRSAIAVAAGWSIPIGKARVFWLSPFARYLQIMQADVPGLDGRDAKIVLLGLGIELGMGTERERLVVVTRDRQSQAEDRSRPGKVRDGTVADRDRRPDPAGLTESCGVSASDEPVGPRDGLELKQQIHFAQGRAELTAASLLVLDQVARAMSANRSFRVQIEGHASLGPGGQADQVLSQRRADAVLDYLVTRGVERGRLASKGLGSSAPPNCNNTVVGGESNRRVEFVVYFLVIEDGG